MKNPINYILKKKTFNPSKKLRYATGLGDVITVFLHSRFIGPITYMITGKEEPCSTCNSRRVLLNQLVPMDVWKLFFDTYEEVQKDIGLEYSKIGMDYIYNPSEDIENISINYNVPKSIIEDHPAFQKKGYYLESTTSEIKEDGNVLIETITYKKI